MWRDAALFLLSFACFWAALLALDLYEHSKQDAIGSLNALGYRGPIVGSKLPNEIRLVLLGGSPGFGYGVHESQTISAFLQPLLTARLGRPVSVINLASNAESSVCLAGTLQDFRYLQPDGILIYSGENDLPYSQGGAPTIDDPSACPRRHSVIFRLTGYMPVLPVVLREKYWELRYGSVDAGIAQEAASVDDTEAGSGAADAPLGKRQGCDEAEVFIPRSYATYVERITSLVYASLSAGRFVFAASEPSSLATLCKQQAALRQSLRAYAPDPHFRYIDSSSAVDPGNTALSFDGVHLTAEGNRKVAEALAAPLADALSGIPLGTPKDSNRYEHSGTYRGWPTELAQLAAHLGR